MEQKKLAIIELILSDVDGVLTDGGLYYSTEGVAFKRFNVKDGMAVYMLREAGIKCGVISSDKSEIVKTRAERLKMDFASIGVWEKKAEAERICSELNITLEQVAFIGDDLNDVPLLETVGFSVCPADAVNKAKEKVDFVSDIPGGHGVFRQVADMIIASRQPD
ncbi:MAG: HAD-IIIA family hydrolase [Chlorobi bacterium]|nr:HAD-IIIA family hydrolase [Chlorobiota bacterium]